MVNRSKIDLLVHDEINQHFPSDRVACDLGWVSLKNPGIEHRPTYLNAFNYPTPHDEIDYISQFTREAKIDLVRDFYRQTNGMRLLGGNFHVPGVIFHRPDLSGYDFFCVALDFSNHGGWSLPKYCPENGLMIGASMRHQEGKTSMIYDILTKSGHIVGGEFAATASVDRRFSTIEEWLSVRISEAARELVTQISMISRN